MGRFNKEYQAVGVPNYSDVTDSEFFDTYQEALNFGDKLIYNGNWKRYRIVEWRVFKNVK